MEYLNLHHIDNLRYNQYYSILIMIKNQTKERKKKLKNINIVENRKFKS